MPKHPDKFDIDAEKEDPTIHTHSITTYISDVRDLGTKMGNKEREYKIAMEKQPSPR
jgi:hypothetical protein